jgi:hypothetical protein
VGGGDAGGVMGGGGEHSGTRLEAPPNSIGEAYSIVCHCSLSMPQRTWKRAVFRKVKVMAAARCCSVSVEGSYGLGAWAVHL